MSRFDSIVAFVFVSALTASAYAQPRPARRPASPPPPVETAEDETVSTIEEEETSGTELESNQLRAPALEPPDLGDRSADDSADDAAEAETSEDEGEAVAGESTEEVGGEEERLQRPPGAQSDPVSSYAWSSAESVFTLHGYFRTRGEFQDQFWLGRVDPANPNDPASGGRTLPFSSFYPLDSRVVVPEACPAGPGGYCPPGPLVWANMRLRLQPQLNLSDDVRIKVWLDVLDNVVLGSTSDSSSFEPGMTTAGRSPYAAPGSLGTVLPPTYGRNSLTDSIIARRAWAEVRDRALGELRFGRMGFHWGLGMLANAGDDLDGDYSTDVDRVMLMTKLAGLYFAAAYDFQSSGFVAHAGRANPSASYLNGTTYDPALPYLPTRLDRADQFFFAVAKRTTPEEQELALARGDVVLNAGAFFVYRNQFLDSSATPISGGSMPSDPTAGYMPSFALRGLELFIPDVWAQFLWGKLRLEIEAAFEGEYRLLDDKLGIYFSAGVATGDSDTEGLSAFDDTATQRSGDRTISTFRFHPNYRVDLILWRNLMRQITGAYYFRPGVSYDFIRGEFGELLGARADVVWSRATNPIQTWGNRDDLGVEIDGTVYFRSDDGPEIIDGFYAYAQYGILFPLAGLGYLDGMTARGLQNAQTLRLVLGVVY